MSLYGVLEFTSITTEDLQTSPNPDGSDFGVSQIINTQPGLIRVKLSIAGKAIASLKPTFRFYSWEPEFNAYCREAAFTLDDDEAITNTEEFEYRSLEIIELGPGVHAIVLEDAEEGADLKAVWRLVANGSI